MAGIARIRAVLPLLALMAALAAAPSASALEIPIKVKAAKHKDGPYRTDLKANIGDGEKASFWFRVKNTGNEENMELLFDDVGTSDNDGFKTRWFKRGDDISSDVEGPDGYNFRVDPGQSKYFNAKQTAPSPTMPTCLGGQAGVDGSYFVLTFIGINGTKCSF